MSKQYITDQNFKNIIFSDSEVEISDYENCTFIDCSFSNANLSDFSFEDCRFENCDFSNTKIRNTAFKNVHFNSCKLIGLQFDECNPFLLEFTFTTCLLNYSSFFKVKLKKTVFTKCSLHEVDFSQANLSEANFTECDFAGATFSQTNLRRADLRTSFNFNIYPEQNQISGAKFSMETLPGLLYKYKIKIG
ncbi:pentapeptide repeat-containing protein [uncultured Draconibacterium sp.]|uniref:pentapeptide repeat-containing protein n=1 Tax=uncultured Draconibacterium sp. TaxID=1573823 RepID=UPI00321801C2